MECEQLSAKATLVEELQRDYNALKTKLNVWHTIDDGRLFFLHFFLVQQNKLMYETEIKKQQLEIVRKSEEINNILTKHNEVALSVR